MLEGISFRNPVLTSPAQAREFATAKHLVSQADALVASTLKADETSLDSKVGSDVWVSSNALQAHEGAHVEATVNRNDEGCSVSSAVISKKTDDGDRFNFTYVANGALGETEGDRYVISTRGEDGRHRYEIVKDRANDTLVMFVDYSTGV